MSSLVQSAGTVKQSAFNFITQVNLANSQVGKRVKIVMVIQSLAIVVGAVLLSSHFIKEIESLEL